MKKITLLIPVLFTLFGSGCASFGPTILIETEQPEEDFLVLCEWHKNALIDFHGGGRKQSDSKAYVTESGKEVDCGVSIWGGHASATVMHLLYKSIHACNEGCDQPSIKIEEDLINVKMDKTRLGILDQLKEQFDEGYFNKFKWPESKYADYVRPVCGFSWLYVKYYVEAKGNIDVERFKKAYDAPMFECLSRTYEILKKYDKGFPDDADARKTMDNTWRKLELME